MPDAQHHAETAQPTPSTRSALMSRVRIIGVDPGPVPGIVLLDLADEAIVRREALQCTHSIAAELVESLFVFRDDVVLAVETFVVGRGSMRSARAGAQTRDLVGQLQRVAAEHGVTYVERTASQVKPWATEVRLAGAGLLEPTKAMRHARDAAKHALYAAVRDGHIPDPLSKRST